MNKNLGYVEDGESVGIENSKTFSSGLKGLKF